MIPVFEPDLNGNELSYLKACIETGWVSAEGAFVQQLEQTVAMQAQRAYGVAVCNGTAALELAVKALDISSGDEVICPTFTIISIVHAIIRAGAKPVLVDTDADTWNMDISQIEAKIGPRTKAIVVVHTYGLPVEMNPILEIAQKHNLKLIEDAAEVIGQTYCNRPCGSFGKVSVFSFYANKSVTTGEGGMILTNDETIADKCRRLRGLAFGEAENRFVHTDWGHNYRLSNLQAAIGVAQMERLTQFLQKKRQIGAWYQHHLQDFPLQRPLHQTDYAANCYWVFGVKLIETSKKAVEVMQELRKNGIDSRPFFYPMHQQPIFKKARLFQNEHYAVAENLAEQGFYLPTGMNLQENQIQYISQVLGRLLT